MIALMIWLICATVAALFIDHNKWIHHKKITNKDCILALFAWPYVLVKELMK